MFLGKIVIRILALLVVACSSLGLAMRLPDAFDGSMAGSKDADDYKFDVYFCAGLILIATLVFAATFRKSSRQ